LARGTKFFKCLSIPLLLTSQIRRKSLQPELIHVSCRHDQLQVVREDEGYQGGVCSTRQLWFLWNVTRLIAAVSTPASLEFHLLGQREKEAVELRDSCNV